MIERKVLDAFDLSLPCDIYALDTGLINKSFVVTNRFMEKVLIQQINTTIFSNPIDVQENYQLISDHLKEKNSFLLPKIFYTKDRKMIYTSKGKSWRCMEFKSNSYSPLIADNPKEAYTVAKCFGKYSADLMDLGIDKIKVILPGFHNLNLRFQQFEKALNSALDTKKSIVKEEILMAYNFEKYVHLYNNVVANPQMYPLHILHQDCKIANILFSKDTHKIICPIDLDTTQPGLFFSDLGDMIRSMVPNISENEPNISEMEIREDFLSAIKEGYLDSMGAALTKEEMALMDKSGPIIIYMQALRFLTDYLNGDIYYQTNYEMQNRDRAKNQFHLLHLINKVLKTKVSDPLFSI